VFELFAMSGREGATVNLSLSVLAEHGADSGPHADDWGIAFYEDNDVRVVRDTVCASKSKWQVQCAGSVLVAPAM